MKLATFIGCVVLSASLFGCGAAAEHQQAKEGFANLESDNAARAAASWEKGNAAYEKFMAESAPVLPNWDAAYEWANASVNTIKQTDTAYADAQMHGGAEKAYLTHFNLGKMYTKMVRALVAAENNLGNEDIEKMQQIILPYAGTAVAHFDAGKDADDDLRAKVSAEMAEAATLREEMAQLVAKGGVESDD